MTLSGFKFRIPGKIVPENFKRGKITKNIFMAIVEYRKSARILHIEKPI